MNTCGIVELCGQVRPKCVCLYVSLCALEFFLSSSSFLSGSRRVNGLQTSCLVDAERNYTFFFLIPQLLSVGVKLPEANNLWPGNSKEFRTEELPKVSSY